MKGEQHTQRRIKLEGRLEDDYLTDWKRVIGHKAGTRKSAKAKYNRRFRRLAKESMDMAHCSGRCWLCEATTCAVRTCEPPWDEEIDDGAGDEDYWSDWLSIDMDEDDPYEWDDYDAWDYGD